MQYFVENLQDANIPWLVHTCFVSQILWLKNMNQLVENTTVGIHNLVGNRNGPAENISDVVHTCIGFTNPLVANMNHVVGK